MNKKKRIILFTLAILVLVGICFISFTLTDNKISTGISTLCSLLSIVLSIVALWYTFKSGVSIDEQFTNLQNLINKMQSIQHKLEDTMNNVSEDTLSPELKEKLNDFKANLESDDFEAY